MNKLCCVLNTSGSCDGCGRRWCQTCEDTYGWSRDGDHSSVSTTEEWKCPVVGRVTLRFSDTLLGPWKFVIKGSK